MKKSERYAWEKFRQTGAINDYLNYRMSVGNEKHQPFLQDTPQNILSEVYPTAQENKPNWQ